jgi:hypothetical protein
MAYLIQNWRRQENGPREDDNCRKESTCIVTIILPMADTSGGDRDDGKREGDEDKADAESSLRPLMKRNSLMVDDFPDFDPANLDVEDDWRDVFDDEGEEDNDDSGPLSGTNADESASSSTIDRAGLHNKRGSGDGSATNHDSRSADTSMSPPPPQKRTSSTVSSMPTTFSSIPGIGELSATRHPMDHSITRRKKTAGTVDRRESAPPTWHSEAADLPHRQAMVQDM